MASYVEQSMAKIKEFEGSIPWMYLDTLGNVTVGVGLMLATETAAQALPFTSANRAATPDEISREYLRVSGMKQGRLAKFYCAKPPLQLSPETIDGKLRDTLVGFEGYLRSHIRDYDALPDPGKLGLLDMIYNLGPGRLFAEYPKLMAALERGDWKAAAAASARRGPGTARNEWTKQMFLNAAASVDINAEAEGAAVANIVLGLLSALAAAAAVAILGGELDRFAAGIRSRQANGNVLYPDSSS